MPSVTVRSKNNPNIVYTYDLDNLIFDRSHLAMAFVGKQMRNGYSFDVIIQTYDFSMASEILYQKLQCTIVNSAPKIQNPVIDVFFEDTPSNSGGIIYLIREYHQEITLEDFLLGKNLNNFSDTQKQLFQNLNSHDRSKVASDITMGVLTEVQYLNNLGICNIDIHPSAVLVDSECKIELMDFGITKFLERENYDNKYVCHPRTFISPEYAAPEIVLGDIIHQKPQTDVYAIGILYFLLITGDLPFKGELYEVLQSQLRESIPFKQITHPTIKAIIKKATEKDIKKRFDSCSHFIAAIEAIDFAKKNQHSWWQKILK